MGEVQKIIQECIEDGIRVGVEKAFREVEQPKKLRIMHEAEQQISWLLEERETFVWVGLDKDEVAEICERHYKHRKDLNLMVLNVFDFYEELEAKLKEKNT